MSSTPGTMACVADPLMVGGLAAGWEEHAMSKGPRTPGGSRIVYSTAEGDFRAPQQPRVHIDELTVFLAGFLGEPICLLTEIKPEKLYIDILIFAPTPYRPIWTFVTCGMSDLPMPVPADVEPREEFERAELVIAMPAGWFVTEEDGTFPEAEIAEPEKFWPITLMGALAKYPHQWNDWLWGRHSINVDISPPRPYADNTKMCGSILLPVTSWPQDKHTFTTKDGKLISFFAVVPLHADEITLKLNKGTDALCEALHDAGYNEILFVSRPSVVRKKGWFGSFKR